MGFLFKRNAGFIRVKPDPRVNNFKTIPGKAYLNGVDNNNGAFVNVGN